MHFFTVLYTIVIVPSYIGTGREVFRRTKNVDSHDLLYHACCYSDPGFLDELIAPFAVALFSVSSLWVAPTFTYIFLGLNIVYMLFRKLQKAGLLGKFLSPKAGGGASKGGRALDLILPLAITAVLAYSCNDFFKLHIESLDTSDVYQPRGHYEAYQYVADFARMAHASGASEEKMYEVFKYNGPSLPEPFQPDLVDGMELCEYGKDPVTGEVDKNQHQCSPFADFAMQGKEWPKRGQYTIRWGEDENVKGATMVGLGPPQRHEEASDDGKYKWYWGWSRGWFVVRL